jgi:hypothetical protein
MFNIKLADELIEHKVRYKNEGKDVNKVIKSLLILGISLFI